MKYNKDLERKSTENNIIFKIGCGYGYGTVSVVGNATRLRPILVSGIGYRPILLVSVSYRYR